MVRSILAPLLVTGLDLGVLHLITLRTINDWEICSDSRQTCLAFIICPEWYRLIRLPICSCDGFAVYVCRDSDVAILFAASVDFFAIGWLVGLVLQDRIVELMRNSSISPHNRFFTCEVARVRSLIIGLETCFPFLNACWPYLASKIDFNTTK